MGYWNLERRLGVAGQLLDVITTTIILKSSKIQSNA